MLLVVLVHVAHDSIDRFATRRRARIGHTFGIMASKSAMPWESSAPKWRSSHLAMVMLKFNAASSAHNDILVNGSFASMRSPHAIDSHTARMPAATMAVFVSVSFTVSYSY